MNFIRLIKTAFMVKINYMFNSNLNYIPILHLDITERCNARCRMCNLWKRDKKDEMPLAVIKQVISDAAGSGCLVVSIGGGEPMLRSDIFKIISYIKSQNMIAHMDTNGTLLTDDNICKIKDSKLDVISVSLDSCDASIHNDMRGINCFDDVIFNIKKLKKEIPSLTIMINSILHKKNLYNLEKTYNFMVSLGVDGIKFPPIHRMAKQLDIDNNQIKDLFFSISDIPAIKENMKNIIAYDKKYKKIATSNTYVNGIWRLYANQPIPQNCYAGYATVLVMADGSVSPCYNFYNKGIVCGNVRANRYKDIINGKSFRLAKEKVKKCSDICWDLCTKEPSLRFSICEILKNLPFVLREIKNFSI